MKICSLYGAGFYYIPGSDFCLKLGGWVRAEYNQNAGGSFNPTAVTDSHNDRIFANSNTWRGRAIITLDVRDQSAYGTVRSYLAIGETATNNATGATAGTYMPRAFIQWAGFTAGLTVSFFDFFQFALVSNQTNVIGPDSGGNGQLLFAYTHQFGNGLSASISLEEPTFRRTAIADVGTTVNAYTGASGWPDIVGNIHVDQAWGSAQVMGALHQVAANYYQNIVAAGVGPWNGHPGDELGYAVGGGIKLNLPMLGKGDWVGVQAVYAQGALDYVGSGLGNWFWGNGQTYGVALTYDAVFHNVLGSGLELTDGWNVVGGLTHHWTPMWQTTLYGGYAEVNYGALANAYIRAGAGGNNFGAPPVGTDWSYAFWQIGSRTTWTPSKGLDLSVDVLYNALQTGASGLVTPCATVAAAPASCTQTVADQDSWQAIFRVQRNFYP